MTTEIAEMTADAKLVYKLGGDKLIALADKYGATSNALTFRRQNPDTLSESLSLAVAVTGSKSSLASLQKATYAKIKQAIREAQA